MRTGRVVELREQERDLERVALPEGVDSVHRGRADRNGLGIEVGRAGDGQVLIQRRKRCELPIRLRTYHERVRIVVERRIEGVGIRLAVESARIENDDVVIGRKIHRSLRAKLDDHPTIEIGRRRIWGHLTPAAGQPQAGDHYEDR